MAIYSGWVCGERAGEVEQLVKAAWKGGVMNVSLPFNYGQVVGKCVIMVCIDHKPVSLPFWCACVCPGR